MKVEIPPVESHLLDVVEDMLKGYRNSNSLTLCMGTHYGGHFSSHPLHSQGLSSVESNLLTTKINISSLEYQSHKEIQTQSPNF